MLFSWGNTGVANMIGQSDLTTVGLARACCFSVAPPGDGQGVRVFAGSPPESSWCSSDDNSPNHYFFFYLVLGRLNRRLDR